MTKAIRVGNFSTRVQQGGGVRQCSGHQPAWSARDSPRLFVSSPVAGRRSPTATTRLTSRRHGLRHALAALTTCCRNRVPHSDENRRHGKCTPTSAWNHYHQSTWWSTMGVRRRHSAAGILVRRRERQRRALLQVPDSWRTAPVPE